MICLMFLSEAYMATISKQGVGRVLRFPGITGRSQNSVELSGQQLYWSKGKIQAGYMQ